MVLEVLANAALEVDDILVIVNVATVFLQHERFQAFVVTHDLTKVLLDLINRSYFLAMPEDTSLSATNVQPSSGDPEAEEQLSTLRSSLTRVLSDISATAAFANEYRVDSQLVTSLSQWLSSPQDQLTICSCLVLGNLARSDGVCRDMVRQLNLHQGLLTILRERSEAQVLHASFGFLRNLVLPLENKTVIGSKETMDIISRFWSIDIIPQVQHASVSLLRQLLNGSIGNVRWLLESLSPDQDSPAHDKTYLSLLLLLFGRTDDVATKIETGRTVATICRCINSSSQGLPPSAMNALFYRLYGMHADIARPLATMVSQSRFPIIRAEGWFALALMARSREGSIAVGDVLQQVEVFGALVTTITGQSTNGGELQVGGVEGADSERPDSGSSGSGNRSEQEREMQAKDRENALVLVSKLLENRVRVDFFIVDILRQFAGR